MSSKGTTQLVAVEQYRPAHELAEDHWATKIRASWQKSIEGISRRASF